MSQHAYKRLSVNSAQGRLYILWAFILLVFLIFPYFTESGSTGIFGCKFHQLTGLSCPTCGMSRSLYELTQFNLLGSLKMHLFGPIIYLIATFLFFKLFLEIISGRSLTIGMSSRFIKISIISLGIAWVVYWLVRMAMEIILA